MKFFTLQCVSCDCRAPLLCVDSQGEQSIRVFKNRKEAQIEADQIITADLQNPKVIEVEIRAV